MAEAYNATPDTTRKGPTEWRGLAGKRNTNPADLLRLRDGVECQRRNLKSGLGAALDPAPQLAAEAEGHSGSHQGQGAGDRRNIALSVAIIKTV